ncbi:MAG: hypothetical protein JWP47_2641 [Polaromonas sp.]|nr:hypothetical protein [Polaromonas sp.]
MPSDAFPKDEARPPPVGPYMPAALARSKTQQVMHLLLIK